MVRSMLRRLRSGALLALALALVCGCGGDGEDDARAGGATDLPGPLPTGVTFREAPRDAPPAPNFSTELLDGTPVTASELWDERPLVLVFTASWCERCADVHRDAAAAVGQHDGSVALLAVVPEDDLDGAQEYAEELDLGHPVAAGNERIWLDYAAREPPLVALVARGGRVLRGWPGGVETDALESRLAELFADGSGADER
jgi:hypothetical protein